MNRNGLPFAAVGWRFRAANAPFQLGIWENMLVMGSLSGTIDQTSGVPDGELFLSQKASSSQVDLGRASMRTALAPSSRPRLIVESICFRERFLARVTSGRASRWLPPTTILGYDRVFPFCKVHGDQIFTLGSYLNFILETVDQIRTVSRDKKKHDEYHYS